MARYVDVAAVVRAPPSAAWRLLTDTRTWPAWGPTITGVEVAGDGPIIGPGSHGSVRTVGGMTLPFRVTHLEDGVRWTWRVAGVPATGHRVEPHPDGCRVVFEVPVLAAPYVAVCRLALRRIARMLGEG